MTTNPFTEKLYNSDFPNDIVFAQTLFNKAILGIYPTIGPMERPRQAIIDFEGAENRNCKCNLDDAYFVMEEYNGTKYWVGVTDIYSADVIPYGKEIVSKYSNILGDNEIIAIIPHCNVDTEEGTIKTIGVMRDFIEFFVHINYRDDQAFYIIANYLWRAFGINITIKENYDKIASKKFTYLPEDFYPFMINDSKYCGVIDTRDLSYTKICGISNRYHNAQSTIMKTEFAININKAAKKLGTDELTEDEIKVFFDIIEESTGNPYNDIRTFNNLICLYLDESKEYPIFSERRGLSKFSIMRKISNFAVYTVDWIDTDEYKQSSIDCIAKICNIIDRCLTKEVFPDDKHTIKSTGIYGQICAFIIGHAFLTELDYRYFLQTINKTICADYVSISFYRQSLDPFKAIVKNLQKLIDDFKNSNDSVSYLNTLIEFFEIPAFDFINTLVKSLDEAKASGDNKNDTDEFEEE